VARDPTPTVQQPAILNNGVTIRSIVSLSEDSAFTKLALTADSAEAFVRDVYLRVLGRTPRADERELFVGLLADGFDTRINAEFKEAETQQRKRLVVSWSNHLSPEANAIKLEIEKQVRAGDPPTRRLVDNWRERAEDMVWVLINSPEFVYLP